MRLLSPGQMKIGVLGGGVMGAGIAQAAAAAGFQTVIWEVDGARLETALAKVRKAFERAANKGKITPAQKEETLARLTGSRDLSAFSDADFVIEAIVEDLEVKRALFRRLDAVCAAKTVFATNTSSLKVADLAVARADRFCGLHFFNPAPLTKLVEVIRTDLTSEATYRSALGLARSLGKTPVTARDASGFVVNFILTGTLIAAARALEKGLASIPDVDAAMTLGCGHPVGPLALMDMIGLDTVVKIADILKAEHREEMYECPPFIRKMAENGWLGMKSGKGFYDYAPPSPAPNTGVIELIAARGNAQHLGLAT